jgi:hypothetical protein
VPEPANPAPSVFPVRLPWAIQLPQAGFEKGRDTAEPAAVLHTMTSMARGGAFRQDDATHHPTRYAAFLDLAKALDSME